VLLHTPYMERVINAANCMYIANCMLFIHVYSVSVRPSVLCLLCCTETGFWLFRSTVMPPFINSRHSKIVPVSGLNACVLCTKELSNCSVSQMRFCSSVKMTCRTIMLDVNQLIRTLIIVSSLLASVCLSSVCLP